MVVGVIFSLALIILYFNLHRIGQPEELLALIRPYFIVNLISVLFVGVFNTLKQFLDGIGNTKVAMWVMIMGTSSTSSATGCSSMVWVLVRKWDY